MKRKLMFPSTDGHSVSTLGLGQVNLTLRSFMAAEIVTMLAHVLLVSLLWSGVLGQTCEQDLSITSPGSMEALSGSCLHIPCTFTTHSDFYSHKFTYGMWIKHDYTDANLSQNTVYSSSQADNKYNMKFIGDLGLKNCTTVFNNLTRAHSDRYYLRIENYYNEYYDDYNNKRYRSSYESTAQCNPLQITVRDEPWSPLILTSGEQDTETVTITCSAPTPCPLSPPTLTWGDRDSPNVIEPNGDGTFTTKVLQSLTLSHDGLRITCSARYPVHGGVKTGQAVIYSPKDTSASLSPGPLTPGEVVSLSCSSRAQPPVHLFTWFRVSEEGATNVSVGQTYTFTFNDHTQGEYYCEAENRFGKQKSTVIHVQPEDVGAGVYNIVKICGILLLFTSLLIIECWFKTAHTKKHQREEQEDYVNCVVESLT